MKGLSSLAPGRLNDLMMPNACVIASIVPPSWGAVFGFPHAVPGNFCGNLLCQIRERKTLALHEFIRRGYWRACKQAANFACSASQ